MKPAAMTAERTRRTLLAQLSEKLIPWAESKTAHRLVLACPPVATSAGVGLSLHPGAPLEENERLQERGFLYYWPEQHVHSVRLSCLCCVLEGEVDWRIGITQSMAAKLKGPQAHCDYHVLSMRPGTFLLIPPGIPYSDGRIVHWERPSQKQPHSLVFWLRVLPTGVFCHFCECDSAVHSAGAMVYFPDQSIKYHVEELVRDLQMRGPNSERIAQATLLVVLLRIQRSLSDRRFVQADLDATLFAPEPGDLQTDAWTNTAVRLACEYIQTNLHQAISVNQIAEHVCMSPTHLNRCFQTEFGKSIMHVVRERRVVVAKSLLRDSELLVQEIGKMVGYPSPSQFARMFSQHECISPAAYRLKARGEEHDAKFGIDRR